MRKISLDSSLSFLIKSALGWGSWGLRFRGDTDVDGGVGEGRFDGKILLSGEDLEWLISATSVSNHNPIPLDFHISMNKDKRAEKNFKFLF